MFDDDYDYDNDDYIDNLDQDDMIIYDGTLQNLTYMLFNFFSRIRRRSFNYGLDQTGNVVYTNACVGGNWARLLVQLMATILGQS
jgi:hypothetical protein